MDQAVDRQTRAFRMGLSFFNPYWELDTLAREGKLQVDPIETPPDNIQ